MPRRIGEAVERGQRWVGERLPGAAGDWWTDRLESDDPQIGMPVPGGGLAGLARGGAGGLSQGGAGGLRGGATTARGLFEGARQGASQAAVRGGPPSARAGGQAGQAAGRSGPGLIGRMVRRPGLTAAGALGGTIGAGAVAEHMPDSVRDALQQGAERLGESGPPALRELAQIGGWLLGAGDSGAATAEEDPSFEGLFGGGAGADIGANIGGPPSARAGVTGGMGAVDPMAELDAEINRLEQRGAEIDQQFDAQREQLRSMFQLSETPEERAQLEFMLGDLEARRDAAHQAIGQEYEQARESIGARAADMAEQAGADAAQVAGRHEAGAEGAIGDRDAIRARDEFAASGLGTGATGPDGRVADAAEEMERRAVSEGDFAQARGQIAADDVAWLGDTLAAEQPAHQGQLQREVAARQADAQMAHQQRVQERIAQERRQMAQLEAQLAQQQMGMQADMAQRGAGMRADALQRQADRQLQREQMALQQGAGEPGAPGGAGMGAISQIQAMDSQGQANAVAEMVARGDIEQAQVLSDLGVLDSEVEMMLDDLLTRQGERMREQMAQ